MKELISRPVGLSFPGLDELTDSLSLLKNLAGTTADKERKEELVNRLFSLLFCGY